MESVILTLTGLSFFFWGSPKAGACQSHTHSYANEQIQSAIYNPKQKSLGAIIILPPTGGSGFLDRRYARSLCQAGFQSIIITQWAEMDEEGLDLSVHQRLLQRGQNAIGEVVSTLNEAPFVGILGTSVGALHGLTAMGSMDTIEAGFFIAGGIPISQVIAESTQKVLATYRKKRMKHFGFKNMGEYAKALAQAITPELEPLTYQEALVEKPMGFVMAQADETVSSHLQQRVVESFQPQTVLQIDSGHVWAIIKAWWFYEQRVVDFFVEKAQ